MFVTRLTQQYLAPMTEARAQPSWPPHPADSELDRPQITFTMPAWERECLREIH